MKKSQLQFSEDILTKNIKIKAEFRKTLYKWWLDVKKQAKKWQVIYTLLSLIMTTFIEESQIFWRSWQQWRRGKNQSKLY